MLLWASSEASAQERTLHPMIERMFDRSGMLRSEPQSPSDTDGKGGYPLPANEEDNEFWDDRFGTLLGSSGVDNEVFAMATNGEKLFIGGAFSKAGDLDVSNLVIWDGARFQYAGFPGVLQGTNGIINDLVVHNEDTLFVAGQFSVAATKGANNIAWFQISTNSWLGLGQGVTSQGGNAFISDLFHDGEILYVGGQFDRAGGSPANNIAAYNIRTKRWQALGDGIEGEVTAIAKGPDGLYVGGTFSEAGGVPANGVARWDGAAWHALAGGGVTGTVNAIAVMDRTVFVGGRFDHAGDLALNNIARWQPDSSKWSDLSGIWWLSSTEPEELETDGVMGDVRTLMVQDQNLYVGGTFLNAFPGDFSVDTITVRYIARWYESTGNPLFNTLWWKGLGPGMDGFVNALVEYKGSLYAGGSFTKAGGQSAGGIARWDGLRWFSLATGVGNFISTMTVSDGNVYVGGEFDQPGAGRGTRLARLDGARWSLLPGRVSGSIFTVAAHDGFVYVGGRFSSIGGELIRNAARFNIETEEWSPLGELGDPGGDDPSTYVSSFGFDGDRVYVGGNFAEAGGVPARNIALWNSTDDSWDDMAGGINGQVFEVEVHEGDVFAAGRFLGAGAQLTSRNIARFDGETWHDLGTGLTDVVWTMGLYGDDLLVGGDFDSAGGITAQNIARWNIQSEAWDNLDGGLGGEFLPGVNAIVTDENLLYIGGSFDTIAGVPARNVARFDGQSWSPLGSGVDNFVFAMTADGGKLYVAGAFESAGEKPSIYFGIFNDPLLSVDEPESAGESLDLSVSPNPAAGPLTFTFTTTRRGHVELKVYDASGRESGAIVSRELPAGRHTIIWNEGDRLPAGGYLCRITADGTSQSRLLVIP